MNHLQQREDTFFLVFTIWDNGGTRVFLVDSLAERAEKEGLYIASECNFEELGRFRRMLIELRSLIRLFNLAGIIF